MKNKNFLNVLGSLCSYITMMIFTFITQGLIVKLLGIEYSGINGLFTNILTMLSVAELGLGTTIIYKLYVPIATNDKETIKSWLNFYKVCYRIVALIVLICGIALIPFIPNIVGDTNIKENIIILYLISLTDTVFSYIMTYKRSILYADQKNYIINLIHIGYIIFMNITQIVLLYLTKNYILFLITKLIYRLLENILINLYVNNYYSYINEKYNKLSKHETKDFFERIRAMMVQKISFVINKGIDNVCISVLLGITSVGMYTNYNLIATTLCGIIYQTISGLNSAIGNLLTQENKEKNYEVYKKVNYINSLFTGICIVGFFNSIQSFITLWLGREYLLDYFIITSFCIYIYSDSIRRSITLYKEAAGICKEDKYMYLIMAVINLILSIILCKIIGMPGVIIGTSISYLFLIFYSYPKYIFKNVFDEKISEYYKETLKYIAIIILSTLITRAFISFIEINVIILKFIIEAIISVLITMLVFLIFTYKNKEAKYIINIIRRRKSHERE